MPAEDAQGREEMGVGPKEAPMARTLRGRVLLVAKTQSKMLQKSHGEATCNSETDEGQTGTVHQ